ncbi:hypothetical protein A2755_00350 [Candidatus Wolfebacteria bacterium RIFCSPHIGHO2_01_FULL_48_22]|uniref:Uncharacterized protein n=1 Tax=Candidatus Wolfebacteria bacterium RIFCSPHIGHO2_01_FULL_48_22 TaxID=1802555 RepID=A0A1F8DVA0_9BACT|nr:MAG: hypothetical protein A2755_00350 [Candidatus Wolfebacteria bacterium RIFCSPHIGHO2_01_FULL_48_22]
MNEDKKTTLHESIQGRIKRGELAMRPKRYFIWRIIGLYALLALLFVVSLFLISFAWHMINEFGLLSIVSAGLGGAPEFAAAFPWHLIIIMLLCTWVALYLIIRHVGRIYKIPRVISLIAILVVLIACAVAIVRAPLAPNVFYIQSGAGGTQLRSFDIFPGQSRSYWVVGDVLKSSPEEIEVVLQGTKRVHIFEFSALANPQQIPKAEDRVLIEYARTGDRNQIRSIQVIEPAEDFSRSGL